MIRGFSYIYYMSIIHVSSDKLLNTIRIDGKIVNYLPLNLCLSCVTSSVVSPSTQSINLTETTHFATWWNPHARTHLPLTDNWAPLRSWPTNQCPQKPHRSVAARLGKNRKKKAISASE